jgi:hypothetical protein
MRWTMRKQMTWKVILTPWVMPMKSRHSCLVKCLF